MPITSLEIKDKTWFRVLIVKKLMNFLDIVVRDYEDLVRSNHEKRSST